MVINSLSLPDCLRIAPKIVRDKRGIFVKPFIEAEYLEHKLQTNFAEEFYSQSPKNVLRGMHFQTPPFAGYKLVSCLYGKIKDVLLDLRIGSPKYKICEIIEMDGQNAEALYLPPGIAHGFLVLSDLAIVSYKTTCSYVPSNDTGIRWDSIPINWEIKKPIMSPRDLSFQNLPDYESPFLYYPKDTVND